MIDDFWLFPLNELSSLPVSWQRIFMDFASQDSAIPSLPCNRIDRSVIFTDPIGSIWDPLSERLFWGPLSFGCQCCTIFSGAAQGAERKPRFVLQSRWFTIDLFATDFAAYHYHFFLSLTFIDFCLILYGQLPRYIRFDYCADFCNGYVIQPEV